MTTGTKAYEPIMLDPTKYVSNFAEWKHPKNIAAQQGCKYNTLAMFANTALVSTVVSVALACFSNFIVLGLALTAASGLAYMMLSDALMEVRIPLTAKERILIGIEGLPIALYRCYSPKAEVRVAQMEESVEVELDRSSHEFKGRAVRT